MQFFSPSTSTIISILFLKFHNELREVDIVPVHKKKSKISKENSSRISNLSNISKVYERCLYDQILIFSKMFHPSINAVFARVTMGYNTVLPVSYYRKIEKNSGLWRCLSCIINRLI